MIEYIDKHLITNDQQLNQYDLSKFTKKFKFDELFDLIFEHCSGLFTPKNLLVDILNKLNNKSLLKYNKDDILKFINEYKTDFNYVINKLPEQFKLYILYFDPINDITELNFKYKQDIYDIFLKNKILPAAHFYPKEEQFNFSLIIINKTVVDLKNKNNLELLIDHELNHMFEPLIENKSYLTITDNKLTDKILFELREYLNDNYLIKTLSKQLSDDIIYHMIDDNEFYQMLSDLCNIITLYENMPSNIDSYFLFLTRINKKYLNSTEFKKLDETIQYGYIFAYICKMYFPGKWKIIKLIVKKQLNIHDKSKIMFLIKNIQYFFKKVFNYDKI